MESRCVRTRDIALCAISRSVSDKYSKRGTKITGHENDVILTFYASIWRAVDESNASPGKIKGNRDWNFVTSALFSSPWDNEEDQVIQSIKRSENGGWKHGKNGQAERTTRLFWNAARVFLRKLRQKFNRDTCKNRTLWKRCTMKLLGKSCNVNHHVTIYNILKNVGLRYVVLR